MIVAIDGPAGAGKSTVARAVAAKLGFRYLDTGAMYRALTWLALAQGVDLDDGTGLSELARANPVEFDADGQVSIRATDVTQAIREREVDAAVPLVAAHPEVREVMRQRQRSLGALGDSVIEGRDIGVVVAPQAELKIWLTAHPAVRAERRHGERAGEDRAALAADLARRDARDARNTHRAEDAVEIDTTSLSLDEVVSSISALVESRR